MPNQGILISTLGLQEAKDSSQIENIITTQDELYRSDSVARTFTSAAAKEVHNYADRLTKMAVIHHQFESIHPFYYRLLQAVRDDGRWEPWILFMVASVEETARQTSRLVREVEGLMRD